MDLTFQVSKTFESKRHIMTLAELYDTKEGEEVVVHRHSWRKQGEHMKHIVCVCACVCARVCVSEGKQCLVKYWHVCVPYLHPSFFLPL